MKIKSEKIINIILGISLLIVSFYAYMTKGHEIKFLIAAAFAFGLVVISIFLARKNEVFKDVLLKNADERDLYIAMKSAQGTLKFINNICWVFGVLFLVLYGITSNFLFMVMGLTLFALIVVMFITLLISQNYYEKNS
ncbi:hypothetical protein SAMN02745195_02434 [Thermoanaerobacter uzonensis DSM 18761]|jgi:hypothetical protein|uniref:DUF2178 domain-containing protein n=1 Tax=Thermoanaerobacter uzonensis DSM 18761 TaxID=1123369 RepID=A0A1M5AYA8_9THEO|nr:hypothetical protein [Thermoanaerobacter uzonensis]SHF35271.1 hypothetical protein SAMN02745195_02434 [Thermoanaerobacter uzonensis DSM 18761]